MAQRLAVMALLFLLLPAVAIAGDSAADTLTAADRAAIRQVIEGQLAALKRDDGALAFSYSSPFIREKFGTAEQFLAMVKIGFPAVYRPREVRFRELDLSTGIPVQKVFFIGPDGEPVLGVYLMEKQPDGSWKINGCKLAKATEVST